MAADLYIHVLTDEIGEDDVKYFFGNTLGSKYFAGFGAHVDISDPRYRRVIDAPGVHVGEVSWLKAAVFDDGEDDFIPDAIQGVNDAIGEDFPVIDDDLIAKVAAAMRLENTTQYDVASDNEIIAWLADHKGQKAFTVSW